jgi:hypothetical protein
VNVLCAIINGEVQGGQSSVGSAGLNSSSYLNKWFAINSVGDIWYDDCGNNSSDYLWKSPGE